MREDIVGEKFQGLTFGISIPLWENNNRVKKARAQVVAGEMKQAEVKQQFYYKIRTLFQQAAGLKATADIYSNTLSASNNSYLLKKAFDAGQISILNYVIEIGLYYDTVNQTLEAERDYMKALAELSAYEL